MDYISTEQAAARYGVTRRRIQVLAAQGRIPGARKVSGVWLVPDRFTVLKPPYRKRSLKKIKA